MRKRFTDFSKMSFSALQDTAWFSCKGNKLENYLKSGYFEKFVNCQLGMKNDPTICFFGKIFATSSCMWTNMQQLFMEIKKNFFIIKSAAVDNFENDFTTIECIRMDIVRVLQFFSANLQQLSFKYTSFMVGTQNASRENSHVKSVVTELVKEIKHLLLFVGCVSNIPNIVNIRDFNTDSGKSATNFYHYYHLCLDIWFNCITIVHNIYSMFPTNLDKKDEFCNDFIDQPSPMLQLLSFLMYDFSILAMTRSQNANSAFSCPCIRDFWIILVHLVDKNNLYFESISFWGMYETILQIIVKNATSVSVNVELSIDKFSVSNTQVQIQNPIEACLWLTSHIAPLHKYNILGKFCEYKEMKSGYGSVTYLMLNLLSDASETREKSLRNALSYCIQLVKLWEPNGDLLLPLADFFIKKIDETFSIQGNEITGLSYLFKDSLTWFTYISNLSNSSSVSKDSSFDRFLCILYLQLQFDSDSLWCSLKGRVYCKFIPKKFKEMSEIGLQNSFSLFLTIVASGHFEIVDIICKAVSVIETAALPRKQIISWKALFVLMFICQERKHSMQKIVALMTKIFNSTCSTYANTSNDSMHRTNLMNLLLIYIDNLNEVFRRNSNLDLAEWELITPSFSDLFSACGITEINYILTVFHNILQRMQNSNCTKMSVVTNEMQSVRLLQAVFHIYPSIQKIATTDTCPVVVSDIAATLTQLTFDFSSSIVNYIPFDFQSIFVYFGYKENINNTISCRYLYLILNLPDLMKELNLKVTGLDALLMQSWLKCSIYIQGKCEHMKELTQKLLQSEVTGGLSYIKSLDVNADDHVSTSVSFYRSVGDAFNKTSTLQQKTQMALQVQQMFKNYTSVMLSKIKKDKDRQSYVHVYKLMSYLVEYCSTVLHFHVSSEHTLLQLLDTTVYPQIIFPRDKALQSLVSSSIKDYLPNLMRGLFKLDYRKDKSIEREIRDIFIYYLGVPPKSNHPLVKLVVDSVTKKPGSLTLDAGDFILKVLESSLLSNNIEKPVIKTLFDFYEEVFTLIPPACKKDISNIILKCALEIYMKQNDSFAEFLRILIKKILRYFKEKMQLSHAKIFLMHIIEWFIREKLPWSVTRGFSVLDLFVEYLPQLMSDVVPFLTRAVENLERNRGLGEDILLRNGLGNIVVKLQRNLNAN